MSLASRIRARFNYLFPQQPAPPQPGPRPPGFSFETAAKIRRRTVADPIHPDFLSAVDPLWPIPEKALKNNAVPEPSIWRKLHPHTSFGRTMLGKVVVPEATVASLRDLATRMFL